MRAQGRCHAAIPAVLRNWAHPAQARSHPACLRDPFPPPHVRNNRKLRSGFAPIPIKLPRILGEDLAGVVVEAPQGSKVRRGEPCDARRAECTACG